MFSANENLLLRQHKRRVVDWVEASMPESILDVGTSTMVMQVSCNEIGCVPLETVIIVVFPNAASECDELNVFLSDLYPSMAAGASSDNNKTTAATTTTPSNATTAALSYKTKILKPLAQVTQDDVLDALPPVFKGGRKSFRRQALQLRDATLAQLHQSSDDVTSKKLLAQYLMTSLQQYLDRDCSLPAWGEEYDDVTKADMEGVVAVESTDAADAATASDVATTKQEEGTAASSTENVVMKRPVDDKFIMSQSTVNESVSPSLSATATTASSNQSSSASMRRPPALNRRLQTISSSNSLSSSTLLAQLCEREHAPGVRRPACPCCDPNDPANAAIMYQLMQL
ncbi:hypothetical protein MPSEU_000553800 [Mayamaea pseudoterrestris]|nr:hypothetical protein MPSEU_000553800 [Mayamaea pseudoterrestris]